MEVFLLLCPQFHHLPLGCSKDAALFVFFLMQSSDTNSGYFFQSIILNLQVTSRWMDRVKPRYPPTTSLCGAITMHAIYQQQGLVSGQLSEDLQRWTSCDVSKSSQQQGILRTTTRTPQRVDQWMDSPFMGSQVGNCNSFISTHYLANVFSMHCGPRASPLCPTLYPTHISFIPSQLTFPFLNYGY